MVTNYKIFNVHSTTAKIQMPKTLYGNQPGVIIDLLRI